MPRAVDVEQRRWQIVLALWAVIYRQGIEAVTYQAVAQEAQISVGRVQHYFTSKRELVLAGCQAILALAARDHDPTAQPDPYQALVDILVQPIPRDEGFRRGSAVWYAYLTRAMVDPQIGAIVTEASQGTLAEVTRLLRRTGLAAQPARAQAARLIALSNGLAQHTLLGVVDADEAVRLLNEEVERLR